MNQDLTNLSNSSNIEELSVEELERERTWLREVVQKLVADVTQLRREQLFSSNGIYVIEKKLSVLDETLDKLTKDAATKQLESQSASIAALSEIMGG